MGHLQKTIRERSAKQFNSANSLITIVTTPIVMSDTHLVTSCLQLEGKTRVDGQGLFLLRVTVLLACGLTAGCFL